MNMTESASQIGLEFVCGKCARSNQGNTKFCGGCGHTLFEPCTGCSLSVRLTDKFCGGCGADLEAALRSRIEKSEQSLVDAVQATKEHRYADAIIKLELLAKDHDYRFEEICSQAQEAVVKVKRLREQVTAKAAAAMMAAASALESEDRVEVIRLLESVPPKLLDDGAKKILAQCRSYIGELTELTNNLRVAIADKNWTFAGGLIDRMIELKPEDQSLQNMACQISTKILAEAERSFISREYSRTVELLDAVPAVGHDQAYTEFRQKIDHVDWLNSQFDDEPYATPTLGRFAVRLSKQSPDDPRGAELVAKISSRLKEAPVSPRHIYPNWTGSRSCHLGGDAAILGWPQAVDCKGDAVIKKMPGRFCVAIGLALQGLGGSRVAQFLWEKKSLLGGIGTRRNVKMCWGIDIGSSGIRAVLLQRGKDQTVVIQAYAAEYGYTNRLGKDSESILLCRDAIKTMVEAINFGKVEVFVNFSSRETLARFLELPPVEDKKAKSLLEAEVSGQFPIAVDDLNLIKWFSSKPEQDAMGRPAAIVAAKKHVVDQRLNFLTEAGLRVTAIQCDSIALVNFVAFEFDAEFKSMESTHRQPAVAIVDAGAASTTLVIVDQHGFWFRTIEGGGDELTKALTRSAKLVGDAAEKVKKDPANLSSPASDYQPVEERQEALASRLSQIIAEPVKNRNLAVNQTWAIGGSCFGHAWLRRVLCEVNQP